MTLFPGRIFINSVGKADFALQETLPDKRPYVNMHWELGQHVSLTTGHTEKMNQSNFLRRVAETLHRYLSDL